ncbi:MAG: TOTE conflict system archaeo-eukaryotic primase domain-containing protein, partial [Roseiarcus sp.]
MSKRPALSGGAEIAHEFEVEIERIRARLAANEAERKELEAALRDLVSRCSAAAANYSSPAIADVPGVTAASSTAEKIALFRRLFAGRADIFPVRWENRKTAKSGYAPACANEWVRGICGKPQVKCGECPHQAFIPVTDDIIEKHLRGGEGARASGGDFVAGVYPLLPDETCWFLAADFDEESWAADALAVLETCQAKGVPAALERSRSGNGGHVWIFFSEPVSAR